MALTMINRLPPTLDIEKFVREHNNEISGTLCLKDMPRLQQACASPLPIEVTLETPIASWRVWGEMKKNAFGSLLNPWLFLEIKAELPVRCERCLQAVMQPLDELFEYRFVATEERAIEEDSQSEEVVLATSKTFNLLELCEDELIMAIPYMPLHEVCPTPLINGLDKAGIALQVVDKGAKEDEKQNPFAALEQLKKNLH